MAEMTFDVCTALFARYDISLNREAFERFDAYAKLLLSESAIQNVTAVRTLPDIWTRHFLDAAYVFRYLGDAESVIDIGTGGGIPAIPLAILCPALRVTMLDSEQRKIEFCEHVVSELGLSATAICGRAEELGALPKYREQFDLAISRAMANGSMLSELVMPFVKVGGKLLAMKGRNYDPAVERFESAVPVLGGVLQEPVSYTIENEPKTLILVDKTASTDSKYPRRFAKMKRSPL
jgi:16S rRNA (guanine527-N7)-methyltransferase